MGQGEDPRVPAGQGYYFSTEKEPFFFPFYFFITLIIDYDISKKRTESSYEYYIHYDTFDRRMDDWITFDKLQPVTPVLLRRRRRSHRTICPRSSRTPRPCSTSRSRRRTPRSRTSRWRATCSTRSTPR